MNVLGMGPMELMLIVVLALIVFGPAKLPEIMGQIGRAIGDFRRATSELSDEFNRTIQTELQETRAIVDETRQVMQETTSAVREAHTAVGEASAVVKTLPAATRVADPPTTASVEPPVVNGTEAPAQPAEPVATNGPIESEPPLADTSQWSWETAAPPEPVVHAEPVTDPVAEPEPVTPDAEPLGDEEETPKRERQTTARDELVPPY
jgi:TatA/E family protein of Tat protein translocase